MPKKKLEFSESCDKYRQKRITDFFPNSSKGANRKLFTAIHKGNSTDIDSVDNSSSGNMAMKLPYPMSSDDEETGESLNETWINLNKLSSSHSKHNVRPTASSTPLKSNYSPVILTSGCRKSKSENVSILQDIQLTPKRKRNSLDLAACSNTTSSTIGLNEPSSSNCIQNGGPGSSNTASTTIESNGPSTSNCKQYERPGSSNKPVTKIELNKPSTKNSKQDASILHDNELNLGKTFKLTFGEQQPYYKETSRIPCKKTKIDLTLKDDPIVKMQLEIGVTVGGSIEHISNSEKELHSVYKDSPRPSETKPLKTLSSSSNKILHKNKVPSRRLSTKKNTTIGSPIKLKAETKEKKSNTKKLELLKNIFQETIGSKRELLTEEVIEVVEEFMKLDANHQILLMNLFLRPKWHNMREFCEEINLDQELSPVEITRLYEYHKNGRFVDTDISLLSTDELIESLSLRHLKLVAADLKIEMRKKRTKGEIKALLREKCGTLSTLTMKKSSEDVLKEAVLKHLGYCIKLKEDIKSSFYKVYGLKTYSNFSYCEDDQNFWKDTIDNRVVYPKYSIENNFTPFKNREQYSSFYEAIEMQKELKYSLKLKNYVAIKSLCDVVFHKLQHVNDDGKWRIYDPDHIHKFSSEYHYISLLTSAILKLPGLYFENVKVWLEFLINHNRYRKYHLKGVWFKKLADITIRHCKQYDAAAKIVIEAFEFNDKEKIFDEIQLYQLNKVSDKLVKSNLYGVCRKYKDRLYELSQQHINTNTFQNKKIDVWPNREALKGKRTSKEENNKAKSNDEGIEKLVSRDYADNKEFEGTICEGKFIEILFTLFFWDIIYDYYVPLTFISELQYAPLDMDGDSFYKNRKEEIDLRLQEIAYGWSENKFKTFLKDNWNNHSHEKSITDFEKLDKNEDIVKMCCCIDRKVLSNIFGRLVTNYELFRSGFPDLFCWNATLSKYKFVMIQKGKQLEPKEIIWVKYLMDIGAEVEVCQVSVGDQSKTGDGQK